MSHPSPGPAGTPQPAAGSAYSHGGPHPQPNVRGTHPIPGQRRNQGILIGIVVAVVFAIAGLVIFGIVAKSTGAGGFTWGLVFAFVPVIPVIAPLGSWVCRGDERRTGPKIQGCRSIPVTPSGWFCHAMGSPTRLRA